MRQTPQGTLRRGRTLQMKYLFYACQHVLCLSALFMLVSTFDACQFFSCSSATVIVLLMLVRVCQKLKIEFTQNNLLFQSGLSSLSFVFRQNTKCLICLATSIRPSQCTYLARHHLIHSQSTGQTLNLLDQPVEYRTQGIILICVRSVETT